MTGFVTPCSVSSPLMPLALFKLRNVTSANVIGVLWAAGMFAWFFITTLYLQAVLGFTPFQIGLVFLPANLIMAAFSLGLAVLASLAAGRTQTLIASGVPSVEALNGGYHVAFIVGAIFAVLSAVIGATLIRVNMNAQQAGDAPEMAVH